MNPTNQDTTRTDIIPAIIEEAKAACSGNAEQMYGYLSAEISRLRPIERELNAAIAKLAEWSKRQAAENNEIEQVLGKALGYPWFKDDQKNFPGATEADGVCVGEHVPGSLAAEAAKALIAAQARVKELEDANHQLHRTVLVREAQRDEANRLYQAAIQMVVESNAGAASMRTVLVGDRATKLYQIHQASGRGITVERSYELAEEHITEQFNTAGRGWVSPEQHAKEVEGAYKEGWMLGFTSPVELTNEFASDYRDAEWLSSAAKAKLDNDEKEAV